MSTFYGTISAIAASTVIAAFLLSAWKGWQNRQRRQRLWEHLHRLVRLDRRLVALVVEVDQALGRGVGWIDRDTVPPALGGYVIYLQALIAELEITAADLSAMEANGAVERIRSDLVLLAQRLREAMNMYLTGMLATYRQSCGVPVAYRPRSCTVVLRAEDVTRARELRLQARLLFRTLLRRLRGEHFWNDYECEWPIEVRPSADMGTAELWRGEPQAMTSSLSPVTTR